MQCWVFEGGSEKLSSHEGQRASSERPRRKALGHDAVVVVQLTTESEHPPCACIEFLGGVRLNTSSPRAFGICVCRRGLPLLSLIPVSREAPL